jgi:hypothetical protein
MSRRTLAVSLALALLVSACQSARSHPVVRDWLLADCRVGETDTPVSDLKKLQAQGVDLEAVFLQALQEGPDAALRVDVRRAAAERYEWRREMLKQGSRLGLSEADLRDARSVTQKQFIDRAEEKLVLRYKARAVAGLGIVGGERAQAYLKKTAADENSPLQMHAQTALRRVN